MGARLAAFDWAASPLGEIAGWPSALRDAVTLCLSSDFPMTVWWGPELVVIPNDAARGVFGDERFDAALGQPVTRVWEEVVPRINNELRGLFENGSGLLAANAMVAFDREVPLQESYVTYSYTPLLDEDLKVAGVFSVFVETTAEILAARRLQALSELGRVLTGCDSEAELAAHAVDVLSANAADHPAGMILAAPAFEGCSPSPVATFGSLPQCEEAEAVIAECLRTGLPQHRLDLDYPPMGGLHCYPLVDRDRSAPGHVLLLAHHWRRPWDDAFADYFRLLAATLSSAMLTEGELWSQRQHAARLSELGEAKSAFFARVSHELRTPLSLIDAPLEEVLATEPGLTEESRLSISLARANVNRLTRLVDELLDFSRLEAGRVVPQLTRLDVAQLTRGVAASFAPAFTRTGLRFVTEVPDLSRPALLDRDFWERILLNLLSNAAKYTLAGEVALRLWEDGDHYILEVADTGPGIPEADHGRVFTRFERVGGQGRSVPGAGIGLATVRELVELLGGRVSLRSRDGTGCTFTVRVPFTPAPLGAAVGSSITPSRVDWFLLDVPERATREVGTRRGAKLLVVEDDAHLARFLGASLSDAYDVALAPDGETAASVLRTDRPDLVLTDLALPGLNGIDLIRSIRADPDLRDLPVVLLSGSAGDQATALGLAEGADDYVTKPFSLLDLRARLSANLARARQRSADVAWRRAMIRSMYDPVLIFDAEGTVLECNDAFTRLFGYSAGNVPFTPPYPWWPTEAEDAEGLVAIRRRHEEARAGISAVAEFCYRDPDRRPVWVSTADALIRNDVSGLVTVVRTFRDLTRDKQAELRRAEAARVSDEFSDAADLETLLTVAEHGYRLLFEGTPTIQLDAGGRYLFRNGHTITDDDLDDAERVGLAGEPSADSLSLRNGILLIRAAKSSHCRAWVQFDRPRRIGPDEMVVADLLAKAFTLAVDRLVSDQQAASRQAHLETAMQSHRQIGQAVGILVERHRLTPTQAFERLKSASQARNLKVREIASRVIETGLDPEDA
jgi:PAS domain S-box-containing protein